MEVNLDVSKLWIRKFDDVFNDVYCHGHTHYIFQGGRGSTKSSFVGGYCIPLLLISNPNVHAVCYRRFGNTLKTSVYAQISWGIQNLGLNKYFTFHVNPLEIIYKPTGQKILFLGMDDPSKVKSIKLPFGYIGITWWEEFDQFDGEGQIRRANQSTMRGGDKYWNFMSFNPPISINNWVNEYSNEAEINRATDTMVIKNTYLDVPREWLGDQFIDEAEYLQCVNPRAYEHEYLGIPVGTGGNVFDNVEDMEMSNEMIASFDTIYNGLDWGFANDPNAFIKVYYDKTRQDLYLFAEHKATHESNKELYEALYENKDSGLYYRQWVVGEDGKEHSELVPRPLMELNELITADNAEQKSIADFRSWGCFMRPCEKGNDSVRYGIKWLQSLRHIYIDKRRCPNAYKEFVQYEYERDKNNNIISSFPDYENHFIDSTRYSLERFYKRKGN